MLSLSWGSSHFCRGVRQTLSGGEKQRIAIGRALLADPELLLMDEPLASLDDERKAEIFPYIERLRDDGRVPIVFVTHSVAEIARLATSIVILAEGRVSASGPAPEMLRQTSLFRAFGAAEAGAVVDAEVLRHDGEFRLTMLRVRSGILTVPQVNASVGTALRLRLRARDVIVSVPETSRPECAECPSRSHRFTRSCRHKRRCYARLRGRRHRRAADPQIRT